MRISDWSSDVCSSYLTPPAFSRKTDMLNTSFAPWPSFTQEEADAVSAVLLSNRVNYWTGEECRAFEREFAAWSESNHAIAVANGTVALDLALQGLGVGSANGDRKSPRLNSSH